MTLWHYTCDHGEPGIARSGHVIPLPQKYLPGEPSLSWWTDVDLSGPDDPMVQALGLQSEVLISCDRTEFRFTPARGEPMVLFLGWRTYLAAQHPVIEWKRAASVIELGRQPAHWWVAVTPVRVVPA